MKRIGVWLRERIEDLPLRPTIAAALVLGLALPLAIAVWSDFSERRSTLREHLASEHRRLVEVLAIGMSTPIWEVRPDTGQPLIDWVMRDPRVIEVKVSGALMPDFLTASAPERQNGGDVARLERPVIRGDSVIGLVRISVSTGSADSEVTRQARRAFIAGAAELAVGLLLLFPLLRLKVLRPVERLVASSRALAGGNLYADVDVRRRDELGVLARSYEEMCRALRRLIDDLEASNAQMRQRETELNRQTQVLRATLDNMTDGITLIDRDLGLKAWNNRFLDIFSFSPALLREGLSIIDLHALDVARGGYPKAGSVDVIRRMSDSFAAGQPRQSLLHRPNGTVISIRRRALADGGFVTTYTDVTEQMAAQRKADEALALLEAVMDAVPAVLHVKDHNLRYRMVNRYFLELFGLQREAVIGRTVHEIFPPEWLARFVDHGPEVLDTNRPLPFYEWAAQIPGNTSVDLLGTKVPLFEASGTLSHVVTVEIDITQRKRAERELRESEELHRLLVDLAPFGIMVHDRARIRFLNPAGCAILGVPDASLVLGMHVIDFVADDEKAITFDRIRRMFDLGEPLAPEERLLLTIDGEPIEVSAAGVPARRGGETLALVVFQDIGERKQAERALKESERFYRELIEVSPYGILLHNDEAIAFLNPAGQRILGVEGPAQVTGQHYCTFVHPDEREMALARLNQVRAGSAVGITERRLVTTGGDNIDVAIAGVPLMRGGQRLAFVMFGDITERKRAETERHRWLQLLRDAIASIPNGFAVFDTSRRLVTCNAAFAALYDEDTETLAGSSAIELITRFSRLSKTVQGAEVADVAADIDGLLDQLWRSVTWPIEVELRDGRWLLIAHHRTNEGGLVIVRTDITDLKRMQQALRESEELYRLLVDLSPYGILLHDCRAIVFMNPAGSRMLAAIDTTTIVGRHYGSFVIDAERPAALARLRRVLDNGEVIKETERRLLTLDGREITVATSAVPFFRGGERLALVFFVDISERKRAEDEIARQRDALHQAEKMSALGSLLAGVAHELNNPLSVVVGRAIMLEDQSLDPAIMGSVSKIRMAAERCARIVRTFLAMARQQAPIRLPVRIDALIDTALDLLTFELTGAGIDVECRLDAELPMTMGDADQLTQVFNNLIINAKQAMADAPPPRRLVITGYLDSVCGQICVSVSDTGPGIPAEIRARIFDPFFTTKPIGFGTGIGLAVCRGIIETHGGTITLGIDDESAIGAAFTVRLPVANGKHPPGAVP
ncbi:MAG: PAS domain S-box protein [Rhodospirillales bacterium]|nr:PAS domain S-box protein [Rhodospirillales bacterium]